MSRVLTSIVVAAIIFAASTSGEVAFIVVATFIASAWMSNAVAQAIYELRTVGALTDLDSECALALAPALLTAAWIVTIGAADVFRGFLSNRLAIDGRIHLDANLARWIVIGSAAVAVAVGVTQWRDWQPQTACL
jgi:hypothetical protein